MSKIYFKLFDLYKKISNLSMKMLASHITAHDNDYLDQKKSSSKSANIGPKVHIVATWETIKKLKNNTPFKGPVVLRLKYPAIWADWAEHGNCYLLKECCFLISLWSPM